VLDLCSLQKDYSNGSLIQIRYMINNSVLSISAKDQLQVFHFRPAFVIRRTHQVLVALFEEEAGRFGVTLAQYNALLAIRSRRNLDQVSFSRLMGYDRSTTAIMLRRLEELDLVVRRIHNRDKRRKLLTLTPPGRALLRRIEQPAERAQDRLIAPLENGESEELLRLLRKVIVFHDLAMPAPLAVSNPARTYPKCARTK